MPDWLKWQNTTVKVSFYFCIHRESWWLGFLKGSVYNTFEIFVIVGDNLIINGLLSTKIGGVEYRIALIEY